MKANKHILQKLTGRKHLIWNYTKISSSLGPPALKHLDLKFKASPPIILLLYK